MYIYIYICPYNFPHVRGVGRSVNEISLKHCDMLEKW